VSKETRDFRQRDFFKKNKRECLDSGGDRRKNASAEGAFNEPSEEKRAKKKKFVAKKKKLADFQKPDVALAFAGKRRRC